MSDAPVPVIVDPNPLGGLIPCTRYWYDTGNGYGVSAIYSETSNPRYEVAAGLWMDRRPTRAERLAGLTEVLHPTDERVHVSTEAEVARLVEHVTALPPLGSVEPPRRLLPDCGCRYHGRGIT